MKKNRKIDTSVIAIIVMSVLSASSLFVVTGCDSVASQSDTVNSEYIKDEKKALGIEDEADTGTTGTYPLPKYSTDKLATEDQANAARNIKAIYVDDFGDLSQLREYPGFTEDDVWYIQRAGIEKQQYYAAASADIVLKALKKRYGMDFKVDSFTDTYDDYGTKYILHCYQDDGKYTNGTDVVYYPDSGIIYDSIYADLLEERYGSIADGTLNKVLQDAGLEDKIDYEKTAKFTGLYPHTIPIEDNILGAKHIYAMYTMAAKEPQTEESLDRLANEIVSGLEHANMPTKFTLMYNPAGIDYSLLSAPDTIYVSKNAVMTVQ